MFRRVRTKLIFWLLLVTLVSMVPVALVPYYSLRKESLEYGRTRLAQVRRQFREMLGVINQNFKPAATVVSRYLEIQLKEDRSLEEAFKQGKRSVLENLERKLSRDLHEYDKRFRHIQLHLLSIQEYDDLPDRPEGKLYETEDGELLLWGHAELTLDEVPIGGFVIGQPIMRRQGKPPARAQSGTKQPLRSQPAGKGSAPTTFRTPSIFVPELFLRQFYGVDVDIIDPYDPWILEEDFVKGEQFQELLQGKREQLYSDAVEINGYLSQALMEPFSNQHNELTGIIILSYRRLPTLPVFISSYARYGIAFSALLSIIVAVFVARSIADPLNRLTKTARIMAKGDLSARVQVTSKDEVGQLAFSFNEMAAEVERSHAELAARAEELETSLRLLNATNRELTRTQNHLENILANIRSGVIVIDNVGRIVRTNRSGQEILGLAEPPDADYREVLGYDEFGRMVESSLHKGISVFQREIAWSLDSETSIPLQVSTVPLLDEGRITGLVVTFHDLSNIRKLERQLVLQDRLAALGRLSAGVAHEIRNPLGVIKGSAELLRKRFGDLPGEEGLCDFILEEVARLSRVVSDFLNFARPPTPELEEVDVNAVIRKCLQYLEHQDRSHHVYQEFDLAHNLPSLRLDPNLFQQVLLNVFLNAQEAMPEGGTIRVRTRRVSAREVVVEVEDTGVGIPSENLQHIFDPFFTSKQGGTGLGLSVVHQIVSSHGGRIEVDSREGVGTIFRLVFPVDGESLRESSSPSAA